VAVGAVLLKERREDRRRQQVLRRQAAAEAVKGNRRYARWKTERGQELDPVPQDVRGRLDF
jgi:hypothetical protein